MLMETEKKCSELRWGDPVQVRIQHGRLEDICGPQDALNCLTHRWPVDRGVDFERARQLCMAALGGRIPLNNVRDAFVAACVEAKLSV